MPGGHFSFFFVPTREPSVDLSDDRLFFALHDTTGATGPWHACRIKKRPSPCTFPCGRTCSAHISAGCQSPDRITSLPGRRALPTIFCLGHATLPPFSSSFFSLPVCAGACVWPTLLHLGILQVFLFLFSTVVLLAGALLTASAFFRRAITLRARRGGRRRERKKKKERTAHHRRQRVRAHMRGP